MSAIVTMAASTAAIANMPVNSTSAAPAFWQLINMVGLGIWTIWVARNDLAAFETKPPYIFLFLWFIASSVLTAVIF